MDALGLNSPRLAELIGMDRTTPAKWLSGAVPVPPWVMTHLVLLGELRGVCERLIGPVAASAPARLNHVLAASEPGEVPPLTPAAFSEALRDLGWRQADFARAVGCDMKTPSRWATGEGPIPLWVGAHLRLLLEVRRLQTYLEPSRERKARSVA